MGVKVGDGGKLYGSITAKEIAEALGVSPTNAGVLVYRARKALAGQLARFLEGSTDE